MLDENPVLDAEDVRGDPVRGRPEPGEPAMEDDEVAVRDDDAGLVLQGRRGRLHQLEQPLPARRDVGAVLDVAGRPVPLGLCERSEASAGPRRARWLRAGRYH